MEFTTLPPTDLPKIRYVEEVHFVFVLHLSLICMTLFMNSSKFLKLCLAADETLIACHHIYK